MAGNDQLAVAVRGLRKRFGSVLALDDVSFEVARGEVFGYLGPNGAGKTTTIRVLLDLLRADDGEIEVLGLNPRSEGVAMRSRIGYMPGEAALWSFMDARETITHVASMRGVQDRSFAFELAGRFHLDMDRPVGHLSRGNRQKVLIVLAFMHQPELVILDEPTSGLDPLMQIEFYSLVREWAAAGRTVFLSSHVMGEVDRIASRVAIIRDGRIVVVDDVENLKRRVPRKLIAHFPADVGIDDFAGIEGITAESDHPRELRFTIAGPLAPLLRRLADRDVLSVETMQGDLEQAFLDFYSDGGGRT